MPGNSDIRQVLTFGGSRSRDLLSLLVGLAMSAIGIWMVVDSTNVVVDRLAGAAVLTIGVIATAVGVASLRGPDTPILALSREGILFRQLSDKLIPWSEVLDVDTRTEYRPGELLSWRCVTSITVSRPFYDRLGGMMPRSDSAAVAAYELIHLPRRYGEAVEIQDDGVKIPIARFIVWPRSRKFHGAVLSRWQAFRDRLPIGS